MSCEYDYKGSIPVVKCNYKFVRPESGFMKYKVNKKSLDKDPDSEVITLVEVIQIFHFQFQKQ